MATELGIARVVEKHCPIREAYFATVLMPSKSPIQSRIISVVRVLVGAKK